MNLPVQCVALDHCKSLNTLGPGGLWAQHPSQGSDDGNAEFDGLQGRYNMRLGTQSPRPRIDLEERRCMFHCPAPRFQNIVHGKYGIGKLARAPIGYFHGRLSSAHRNASYRLSIIDSIERILRSDRSATDASRYERKSALG